MFEPTYSLDAVGIVDRKLGVVWSLDAFVDDTVNYTKSVELQLNAMVGAIGDLQVLRVEVIKELSDCQCQKKSGQGYLVRLQQGHSV
jgi:hypothetical protein